MKLVRILWVDSTSTRGWRDATDVREPQTIETVGWLVKETKSSVSVSSHYDRDPQGYAHCDVMTIPRGAIKRMRPVRERKSDGQEKRR